MAIATAGLSSKTYTLKMFSFIHFGLIQNESKDQEGLLEIFIWR